MDGLLLFAHGARDSAWAMPFQAVAEQAQALRPQALVQLGFLEFMAPDLLTAGDALVARGCTRVSLVPLFLGTGGHVRKDIPQQLVTLRLRHPQVAFSLQAAIGESSSVITAMAQVAAHSIPGPRTP